MTRMFQSLVEQLHVEQLRPLRPGTPDNCAMDPKPAPAGEERVREGEANRTQGGLQERPRSQRWRALIGSTSLTPQTANAATTLGVLGEGEGVVEGGRARPPRAP